MSSLTKTMKQQMIDSAVKILFENKKKELQSEKGKIADAVYNDLYSENDRKFMKGSPEGAFLTRGSVSFAVPDGCGRRVVEMTEYRPFFYSNANAWEMKKYASDSPICIELNRVTKIEDSIEAEISHLRRSINGIVQNIRTTKKLLEVWPEAKDYLTEQHSQEFLPAIPVADLNDMISKLKKE